MKLTVLGGLELEGSSFQRPKPLLLLVYLSLEGKQSREHLAELFWQLSGKQLTSRQRRNHLSKALSTLRKHVPGSFASDRTSVWSLVSTDVAAFQQALATKDYARAVETYKGPFLRGHSSGWGVELEEWLFEQRERLTERAQEAFLELAEGAARQRPEEAVQHARSAFRLAEPQTNMLPRFYTLFKGQDSSLAREVQDLARGYGVTLRSNPDQNCVVQKQSAGSSEKATPHNLPKKGTSFVGRDIELGNVVHQLSQPVCRLLSLVGIGGVGKSRLAVQAAYELLRSGQFQDGIYYVALDALASEMLIAFSIADSLELKLTGKDEQLDQLSRYIDEKELLLILDNFEHLIDGAPLLPQLLQSCPNLKLLVTSRERLNLEEEWVFPTEGLTLPDETIPFEEARYSDAVQLFVQRATQAQLSFELTPDDLPHVLKLCRLVAGSPLALELAAVWLRMMSPETLVREVKRNLDVLEASAKNRIERHKNLRAVFEHSWNLLSSKEQEVLKSLSVFRGGFTKEAAFEVTGASLSTLASLVNKSLLRVLPTKRYDRHPLLYQYMQEKLSQTKVLQLSLQKEHAIYFCHLANSTRSHLLGQEQIRYLQRLEAEHDNFRLALTWSAQHDIRQFINLAGALGWFWYFRSHFSEARNWLDKALSEAEHLAPSLELARAFQASGWLAVQQDAYDQAEVYSQRSLQLYYRFRNKPGIASTLSNLGGIAYYQGDFEAAKRYGEQCLSLYKELGNTAKVVGILGNLASLALTQGDWDNAVKRHEENLPLAREIGNRRMITHALRELGVIAMRRGNYTSAHQRLKESIKYSQQLGDKAALARLFNDLGELSLRGNCLGEANNYLSKSFRLHYEVKQQLGMAESLENLARLALCQGNTLLSSRFLGLSEKLCDRTRQPRPPYAQQQFEETLEALNDSLNEQDVVGDVENAMTLEQAISYALETVPDKAQ